MPLSAEARFEALTARRIDLLSRNSTWTMSRDLELGLEFAGISYFDGQGFLVPAIYGATSALQLDGANICVASGTTSEQNATAYFEKNRLKVLFSDFRRDWQHTRHMPRANATYLPATGVALAAERSLLPVPEDHVILRDVISKEPLGPVTREGDPQWTGLVRWILFALIEAEELRTQFKVHRDNANQRQFRWVHQQLGQSACPPTG